MFARAGTVRAPSSTDLGLDIAFGASGMSRGGERWIGQSRHTVWVGRDQRAFTLVPRRQQFRIRQAADQPWMNLAGEIHTGHVARRGVEDP